MTRWPLCVAEIAIYAVMAGIGIWMALDARERWRQLRERRDEPEPEQDSAAPDQGGTPEVSSVRRRPDEDPDDSDPPPLAA